MPLLLSRGHYLGSNILGLLSTFRRRGTPASKTAYCSETNTSNGQSNTSLYQSNGLCTNFCIQDYAFAILQNQECWCSNYIPSTTTTGCNSECPGYPFEKCGGEGLYGYIALGKVAPSGTLGASITPKPIPEETSSGAPTPSQVTVTADPVIITYTEIVPGNSRSSSSRTSKSSSSSFSLSSSRISTSTAVITESVTSLTWTPTPITSVKTISGSAITVTVTPSEPPQTQSGLSPPQKQIDGGLSTGAAVGLTAGLVALVAILCCIIYLCLRKRRDRNSHDVISIRDRRSSSIGLGGQIPSRTMSENSRYVLGTDGRRVVETWEFKDDMSQQNGKLIPVDPRLDPFAPVYRVGDNKSRDSVNTLRDDLDYSRRVHGGHRGPILRATNPDEDE